jgi:DNA-binding response OmpR family regulator
MNQKVLLADDSLTIQKVIKITLANQPYDITDCSSEEELFKKLPEVKPKLVFLDFNLSEKHTGYELTSKIKSLLPSTKVLLLLGTFDTVDDAAMEKCGASDKIVKPFDSNKFIAICKHLLDTTDEGEEIDYPDDDESDEPVLSTSTDDDNQWTVNHTVERKFEEPPREEKKSSPQVNALDQEVSDWGMSIPNVISDNESKDKMIDLPPVIGEIKSIEAHRTKLEKSKDEVVFPQSEDLDYPTMEELISSPQINGEEKPAPKNKAQLVSLESFNQKALTEEPEELVIERQPRTSDETDISSLEAQIRDEVEDDLWVADEFEDLKKEVSAKMEEVKQDYEPSMNDFDESLFKPLDENESIPWSEAQTPSPDSMNQLRSEMEEMVKKYVKEYMDEMFRKNAEKISWEVIPDLAENLIRQELNKISKQILDEK